jgi:hypothetical protein
VLDLLAPDKGLHAASVEVRQLAREEFIESHFDGKSVLALVPIFFWLPAVVVPPQFELGDLAVNMQQIAFLFEGVYRT